MKKWQLFILPGLEFPLRQKNVIYVNPIDKETRWITFGELFQIWDEAFENKAEYTEYHKCYSKENI